MMILILREKLIEMLSDGRMVLMFRAKFLVMLNGAVMFMFIIPVTRNRAKFLEM